MQCSLIQELILYEFEQGHNTVKTTNNICCAKGEGAVDHIWLQKFWSGYRNLDNQARTGRFKTMGSEAMLQVIKANPVSSTWAVSGELSISQSSPVWFVTFMTPVKNLDLPNCALFY